MMMKAATLRTPVCAKHCSKPFPEINSFTPHNNPWEAGTIFISILRKWGTKWLSSPRSQGWWRAEVGCKPGLSNSRSSAHTYNVILFLKALQFKYVIHLNLFWCKQWSRALVFLSQMLGQLFQDILNILFLSHRLKMSSLSWTTFSYLLESVSECSVLSHFIPVADVNSLYNKGIISFLSFLFVTNILSHTF